MPYLVRAGDTIYDACYNTAGSLAELNHILDDNIGTRVAPISYKNLVNKLRGVYSSNNNPLDGFHSLSLMFETSEDVSATQAVAGRLLNGDIESTTIQVSGGRLQYIESGETIIDIPVSPNTKYHVLSSWNKTYGSVWINGAEHKIDTFTGPAVSTTGLFVGDTPSELGAATFKGEIYFLRAYNFPVSAEFALMAYNNGDPLNFIMPDNYREMNNLRYVSDFSSGTDGWAGNLIAGETASVSVSGGQLVVSTSTTTVSRIVKSNFGIPTQSDKFMYLLIVDSDFDIPTETSVRPYWGVFLFMGGVQTVVYFDSLADPRQFATMNVNGTNPYQYAFITHAPYGAGETSSTVRYNSIQIRNVGCVGEYLAQGASNTSWADSSNQNRPLTGISGNQAVFYRSYDVPSSNQFETYTPQLNPGQILSTESVLRQNLRALATTPPFNSSYSPVDVVEEELAQIAELLDETNPNP